MRKKRTPWPRWAKVLRNLLLAALLGFMMWDLWDQPAFSYMQDLRRRERQMLFPEPEAVVELRTLGGVPYRIELTDDMAVTSYPVRGNFFASANASVHFLREGPDLLCVSRPVERTDEFGQPLTYAAYAAVRPPADAVGAALTLFGENTEHMLEGVREGEVFMFYDHEYTSISSDLHLTGYFSYELEFFDGDGNRFCRISR